MEKNVGLDVVVIGGGVVGICTAYFLQKAGMRVTLIEQSKVGSNVARTHFVDCIGGGDIGSDLFKRGKVLLHPLLEDLGYNMRLVSRFCFTSQTTITNYSVRRGALSHELLMHEMLIDLRNIVKDRGGRIFENLEVNDLLTNGDKVVGVSTIAGQFLADETVIAAGVLSSRFEGCLNLEMGLKEERVAAGDDLVDVPFTPVGKPYIGRPQAVKGAIVAVGHDVNAICALAVGQTVADLVAYPGAAAGYVLRQKISA